MSDECNPFLPSASQNPDTLLADNRRLRYERDTACLEMDGMRTTLAMLWKIVVAAKLVVDKHPTDPAVDPSVANLRDTLNLLPIGFWPRNYHDKQVTDGDENTPPPA